MNNDFPLVPLRNCIVPIERSEVPIAGKIYRQIGVRLWGEGAYERESAEIMLEIKQVLVDRVL